MDRRANKGAIVGGLLGIGIALGLLIGAFTFGESETGDGTGSPSVGADQTTQKIRVLEAEVRALRRAKAGAEAALAEARERARGGGAAGAGADASSGAGPAAGAASASAQRISALQAELATTKKERDELRVALKEHETPPGKRLPVSFGTWGELDLLRDADWPGLAGASRAIRDKVPAILDPGLDAKKKLALQIAVAKENQKLAKLALKANGKLPTHASGNGEYTHPMVLSNIVTAELEAAGLPLSEEQAVEITRLGEAYEAGWGLAQQGYLEDTPVVQKILDELTLKQRFTERFDQVLSGEQRAAVFDPQTRHVIPLDVVSPGLLLMGRARPVAKETVEEIKTQAAVVLADAWGVSAEDLTALPGGLDGWARQLAPLLAKPLPRALAGFYRVDEAILACRAHLELYRQALALAPTEEIRKQMRDAFAIVIPHLVEPPHPGQ